MKIVCNFAVFAELDMHVLLSCTVHVAYFVQISWASCFLPTLFSPYGFSASWSTCRLSTVVDITLHRANAKYRPQVVLTTRSIIFQIEKQRFQSKPSAGMHVCQFRGFLFAYFSDWMCCTGLNAFTIHLYLSVAL